MTIRHRCPPSGLHRMAHTSLGPDWKVTGRIPLILDVLRRQFKVPVGHIAAALDLLEESSAILAQLRIGEVLAADLELVEPEPVGHVAVIVVGLGRERLECVGIPIRPRGIGAELVVARVIDWIVAVAAVDEIADEDGAAVGYGIGTSGIVRG